MSMQSWMWLIEVFYNFEYPAEETWDYGSLTKPAIEVLQNERTITHMLPAAMSGLLNATYWVRLWVVQEIALAPVARVRCGSFSLLLEHFEAVLGYCRVGKMALTSPVRGRTDERPKSFQFHEPPTTPRALRLMSLHRSGGRQLLWELLNEFSDGQCTEPRDKIYSLLSLARPNAGADRVRDLIGVDYDKQDLEVFWDTLFECDAPFNWLRIMRSQLESYLHVASTFETLDEYRRSTSVSTEHKRYAIIAIEVFWAIRSYKRRWTRDITTSQLDAMIAGKRDWGSESKEDNAIMIGLLLGTGDSQPNQSVRIAGPQTVASRLTSVYHARDEASVGGGNFGRWSKGSSPLNVRLGIQSILCSMCNERDFDIGAKRDWSELQEDAQFRIPGTESRLIIPAKQSHANMWLETTKFAMHIPRWVSEPHRWLHNNRRWGDVGV